MKTVEKPETKKGKDDAQPGEQASHATPKSRKEIIKKHPVKANVENYEQLYAQFGWDDAKRDLSFFADGRLNAAYNAVDRHMHDGRRNKVALYAVDAKNKV